MQRYPNLVAASEYRYQIKPEPVFRFGKVLPAFVLVSGAGAQCRCE